MSARPARAGAPTLLVVAKAPVPGVAKTRLATTVGASAAATVAAAALLDTLDVAATSPWPVVIAVAGSFADGVDADAITAACAPYRVVAQRGETFAERLTAAHADADDGHGVVQIGMDTPQVTPAHLEAVGAGLAEADAVLGPATDGGWWVLGVRAARWAEPLADVPMSRHDTGERTSDALARAGARVAYGPTLSDLDTWDDAVAIASAAPQTRTARAVQAIAAARRTPGRRAGAAR
ncbi:hypothetical protein CLV56_0410 [Mumia flava]|uniref:Glycosyltransferase A (GT-A) superfamily protein (DUF2064 family) n=1 Tax=Mumia flava TaxID=1348852 RepID=A0A0B2BLG6_9ACTN|nr:DUF2064 domain-containing protein [Mumia flava]PJJ56206.1 hypothetical protein CLV56_0410 [Mumia flava]